ncbi:MAG: DUF11 domain-containing protein [Pyrinomonadaceae bacterium]
MKILHTLMLFSLTVISLIGQVNKPAAPVGTQPTDPSRPAQTRLPCMMPTPTQPTTPKASRTTLKKQNQPDDGVSWAVIAKHLKSVDSDCDGISNYDDNCPQVLSKNLTDRDGDGFGDVCDSISSDIRVKMTPSRNQAKVGSRIRFSIIITNDGPTEEAMGINLIDVFPSRLKVGSIKTKGAECEGMADEADGGLLCEIASLPVGKSATIIVNTTAVRTGTIRNTVEVENGIGDLNRKNNRASIRIEIIR